jgi:hypothetical protein
MCKSVREASESPLKSLHTPGDGGSYPTLEQQVGALLTGLLQRASLFRYKHGDCNGPSDCCGLFFACFRHLLYN